MAIAVALMAATPAGNYLPGYMKDSERAYTEEQHLRLDSLMEVYEKNEAYLNSILNVMNPTSTDSIALEEKRNSVVLSPDSLLPTSAEEKAFMEYIRERDKYNIDIISPADAETLMFGNVNKKAVISSGSKDGYKADLLLPPGSEIEAVAEGKVISIATSLKTPGSYEVIIQHPKGFLSKSSRLSNILVSPGERVAAGQVIASTSSKSAQSASLITFELWHDGNPLKPSRYLNGGSMDSPD